MTASALTEWARLLFGSFQAAGVRSVVVSPGSRSTPFVYAALTTEGLRCYSVLDERSAGFFALGQARVSGHPSVVVCTSGSAAANYFPAVVEAAESGVPLVIVTADRPFELQDTGAPQCMDQVKLYGGFVRRYVELGHPEPAPAALDGLVRRAAQAVELAVGPLPGPVHVNARARKPLEPVAPRSTDDEALHDAVSTRLARGVRRVFGGAIGPDPDAVEALARLCRDKPRGLIVCGPLPVSDAARADALSELARVTGYPLVAEATSQTRFAPENAACVVGAADALFGPAFTRAAAPELVLEFGAPPTSSAFGGFAQWTAADRVVIRAHAALDPQNRAGWAVVADPIAVARALVRELAGVELGGMAERRRFSERVRKADALYFALVERAGHASDGALGEAAAVRAAVDALPAGSLLGLGNSLPLRDVDAFVPPSSLPLYVWSQRGVNGIDGLVSGAIGAATAAGVASVALLGDVSFLHDVGGLAAAAAVETPLALVVVDNGGGQIFAELPIQATLEGRPELARFWLTPHGLDLRHAAELYRVAYARAETLGALRAALGAALARPGVTLVHAVVRADSARSLRAELARRFAAEVEPLLAEP